MSIKKIIEVIIGIMIIAGVFWLLILGVTSKDDIYKKETKDNIEEYKNNVMRFPIQIKSGEYNSINNTYDLRVNKDNDYKNSDENF